ncbi:hypothetical protein F53441_7141 [Fusarium austroafricanum]|uniref:BTB domain-containing protein n=1 Tax=Fusarium austroafricanum TaxID=2364996 RepID=A0A8H4KI33_9HYPO|nr:hypothetical protein F53441_7141 [Fusarium austroafricanum]
MASVAGMESDVEFTQLRSPYGTEVCKIGFSDGIWLDGHWAFIHKCPQLAKYVINSASQGLSVYLPTIPHDIGHVIIHYLYTEQYQILEMETEGNRYDKDVHQFSTACKVLHVADNLDLEALTKFCKTKILSMCQGLDLDSIHNAVIESNLDLKTFPQLAAYLELRQMSKDLFSTTKKIGQKLEVPSTIPQLLLKVAVIIAKNSLMVSGPKMELLKAEIADMMMHITQGRYNDPRADFVSMTNRLFMRILSECGSADSEKTSIQPQGSTANNTSSLKQEVIDDGGCFGPNWDGPPHLVSTPASTPTVSKPTFDVSMPEQLVQSHRLRSCRKQSLIRQKSEGFHPRPITFRYISKNSNVREGSSDSMTSGYDDIESLKSDWDDDTDDEFN